MHISVVIPCRNEAASIGQVIAAIPPDVQEIIVVDNNCTDDTAAIARDLGATIVTERQPGYGSAIKAGFRIARGNIIATIDGDGEIPAEKVIAMAHTLEAERLDFIFGNRFPLDDRRAMTRFRFIGNKFFTAFVNLLFGLSFQDLWSGMYVFRASSLANVTLERDDATICPELKILVAADPRLRWREYHIPFRPRTAASASKLSPFKHGRTTILLLLELKYRLWRRGRMPGIKRL